MAKGDDIEERLINFGVRILKLCTRLPKTQAGRHSSSQLLRSGTSPAPNYAEARGAESPDDFIHKLKIALKELNESRVWLLMIQKSDLLPASRLVEIIGECDVLCRIISASIKTSRARNQN
jgi:four helix bundle protein